MTDTQQTVVNPNAKKMQTHENANPRPNAGTQDHGPNPNFRPKQDEVPYNAKKEIAALKQQLQESQDQVYDLQQKWVASITSGSQCQSQLDELYQSYQWYTANKTEEINDLKYQLQESENKVEDLRKKRAAAFDKAVKRQFQMDVLQKQFSYYKTNSEKTIKDLKKQLAKARGEKPKNNSDTVIVAGMNPTSAKLGDIIKNIQEQRSHPDAELCAEPSSQATEVSHTHLKSAKEADLEVQCRKQEEQNQQLQQQLQEVQRQLEEQAAQHRQETEIFQSQINDLKSQHSTNKDLNASHTEQGKEGKADLMPQTSISLQGSAQEKQGTEQGKDEKGDSLLETSKSLQESLQTTQDKENILISKVDGLEEQPTIVPEKLKKKKRNWFLHLFTRNSS